jgi:hypothetical protein
LLFAVDFIFYGTVIPFAASVKSIAYGHPFLDSLINAISFGMGVKGIIIFLIIAVSFILIFSESVKSFPKIKPESIFLAFSAGVVFAWIIGKSNIFPWYYAAATTSFSVAIFLAFRKGDQPVKKTIAMISCLALFFTGSVKVWSSFSPLKTTANQRVERYIDISSALYKYCSKCSLVTSEIGGIGYGFKGVVYDGFGLADPEAITFHPMIVPSQRQGFGVGAIPKAYVQYRNPDFIMSMPVFTREFRSSDILKNYKNYICPFFSDNAIFGDRGIFIHSKKILSEDFLNEHRCKAISTILASKY